MSDCPMDAPISSGDLVPAEAPRHICEWVEEGTPTPMPAGMTNCDPYCGCQYQLP